MRPLQIETNRPEAPSTEPLMTVRIPTYNRPEGLSRTLKAIVSQTFQNLEIIVSDHCSPKPAVAEVIKVLRREMRGFGISDSNSTRGRSTNFQFVLERASGKYFMWAADDDYVSQNYVSTLVNALEQNEHLKLAVAKIVNVNPGGCLVELPAIEESINRLPSISRIRALIEKHYSSWIYGLFRTTALRASFWILRSSTWIACNDRLLLYEYIVNDAVVVTDRTTLYSGCRPRHKNPGYRPKRVIPYCAWALSLSCRALRLLCRARISAPAKVVLVPFFVGHLWRNYWVPLFSLR